MPTVTPPVLWIPDVPSVQVDIEPWLAWAETGLRPSHATASRLLGDLIRAVHARLEPYWLRPLCLFCSPLALSQLEQQFAAGRHRRTAAA
jgi:hypothetical protein